MSSDTKQILYTFGGALVGWFAGIVSVSITYSIIKVSNAQNQAEIQSIQEELNDGNTSDEEKILGIIANVVAVTGAIAGGITGNMYSKK